VQIPDGAFKKEFSKPKYYYLYFVEDMFMLFSKVVLCRNSRLSFCFPWRSNPKLVSALFGKQVGLAIAHVGASPIFSAIVSSSKRKSPTFILWEMED
jgi:hypothetical protein